MEEVQLQFQLEDAVEILERRKWWIVLGALFGVFIGIGLNLGLPSSYQSSTTILVEPQRVPETFVRSTVTLEIAQRLNTLRARVLSFVSLNELIDNLGQERFDPSGQLTREQVMATIRENLTVDLESGRDSAPVFQISYTARDGETAAEVVREIAEIFVSENIKDRSQQANSTAQFLDDELDRLRKDVNAQEEQLRVFRSLRMGALPDQLETNLRALDRLNLELAMNLEAQVAANQRMALLRQQSDDGVAQGMTEPEVGFRALQEARMHLKKTEGIYTEEHPNVQHLRAEVARLEQELEETPESTDQSPVVGPLARSLRLQIESANLDLDARKRRETQIFQEIERLQERVDETPRREQELVGLTRDYNNLTETYRTLLGKKYEAAIARNLEQAQKGERFRLLRPAQVPPHPTWPDPRILIPAGLAVGLAITGLLIVVSEIRHPAFRSVERLKRMIGLPVFASIPEIDNDAIYEVPPNGEVDPKLVVFTAPESAPAEQYRGFIPTLLDSEGCQVILVTSAARGDGKTLTCMNIAVSLATDLDKRVLVIDSDLRRPSVHRVVRVSRKKGLSNILNGESTLEECAVNSKISNLSVLPAGPTVRNPLALMTGESFLELLADARKRYDLILIDSPPLLPVVDTRILRKMSDMLLFVVRADSTPRDAVVRSLRDMRDVAGIVFNGVSPGAFRRHYYYDAYSTYAYGDAPADAEDSVDG